MADGSFNVADFRSIVNDRSGVQEPNKFRVRFFLPGGLIDTIPAQETGAAGKDLETVRFLEFWAYGATIPVIGLMKQQARRYGYGALENRPTNPIYTDVNVNFICDDHGDKWKLFYNWTNMIFNTKAHWGMNTLTGNINQGSRGTQWLYEPYELAYRTEYLTDVQIHTFTKTGHQNMLVVLREAFPVFMGGVNLNWGDNNSFMTLPVTFAYTDVQMFFGNDIHENGDTPPPAEPVTDGIPPLK